MAHWMHFYPNFIFWNVLSCHQGDRGALARATLETLRKTILGILSESFKHQSLASEDPQETFLSLMNLCVKHKHLIPFMVKFSQRIFYNYVSTPV